MNTTMFLPMFGIPVIGEMVLRKAFDDMGGGGSVTYPNGDGQRWSTEDSQTGGSSIDKP